VSPSNPERESRELSLEVEMESTSSFAWPLEVDDGATPSMAVFFSSFASPSARLQGRTMDTKLKPFFISYFFYSCSSFFPVSWVSAISITLPTITLLIEGKATSFCLKLSG
jgi:hypothetical protein